LTLNDLRTIREIFVDILQGMFHPRINYREAVENNPKTPPKTPKVETSTVHPETATPPIEALAQPPIADKEKDNENIAKRKTDKHEAIVPPTKEKSVTRSKQTLTDDLEIADEEPVAEVPRLPSLDERRATMTLKAQLENGSETTETDAITETEEEKQEDDA